MKNIPLILLSYNQPTYLKNAVNWWRWYHPENPIIILDNGSTSEGLHLYLSSIEDDKIIIVRNQNNDCAGNLSALLNCEDFKKDGFEYYVISDPDIMPHPATPPNFLEVLVHAVKDEGFHHAGFGLITSDIPGWLEKRAEIQYNEGELLKNLITFGYKGVAYAGYRAPLDTTFALYSVANGGWHAPMSGEAWSSCLRIFDAFHLQWYIDPANVNPEMDYYYQTAKYRDLTPISAGKNNNRPARYCPQ